MSANERMVIPMNVGIAWSRRRAMKRLRSSGPSYRVAAGRRERPRRPATLLRYCLIHHFSMFHMALPAPVVPPNGPGSGPWNFFATKMSVFGAKPKLYG